ncbi:MAG: RecQ family zinc-binding domain-containing protein, partial [Phaeodactylibacter sp.]|nr:RecQ family zinc-binding domain-containing protein [Phaeodactylibacter sp.]
RDGKKSYAVLLYHDNDRLNLERQFEQSFPELKEVRRVYRALGSYFQLAVGGGEGQSYDFEIVEFARNFQINIVQAYHCLKILEQAGWLVLTEAVFVPSSLMIKVAKDALYDYQLRHPKMDRLLKAILRTYQGAFNHPIKLRESQLARFLKVPVGQLQQDLQKLAGDGIVDYLPQKDTPQVIFIKERVDADNLLIDRNLYNFRKNRHYERIQKAIAYAETPICRSQQLLAYFGETNASKCGICDVCTGRTRTELSTQSFNQYREKIEQLLAGHALSLEQIVESFAPRRQEEVLKTLEYLLDEGIVIEEQNHLLRLNIVD